MSLRIDGATARQFLAARHLLAPPRSLPPSTESVLAVFDRLGVIQFDPLEVAGRNHDLVLAARIAGYRRELTDELLYERRALFEVENKSLNLIRTQDLPYHRISWERAALGRSARTLEEQAELVTRILTTIESEGPRSSTDFGKSAAIDWWWGPTTAVRAVLEALTVTGRVGLARRVGNRRYFDLIERLLPAEILAPRLPEAEQRQHRLLSRYRAHGLLGTSGSGELWIGLGAASERPHLLGELVEAKRLVPVEVEGLRGARFVVAEDVDLLQAIARPDRGDPSAGCSFIAPLDPLLWDRQLLRTLYGFDYVWEVYTPAARRRWGYYVLPVFFGDRFVGRIEPRIDRPGRRVRLLGLHWESGFDPLESEGFVTAFGDALAAYLEFAAAEVLEIPRLDGQGALLDRIAESVPVARQPEAQRRRRAAVASSGLAAR